MENEEKILRITYKQTITNYNFDKIIIDLENNENILKLSKKRPLLHKLYKELMKEDFMFYFHSGTKSYFVKRKLIKNLWHRTDLIQFGDLFYTIELPPEKRRNNLIPLRLVVMFSSMTADNYYSPNIGLRCFMKNFPTIQSSIVKNTIVMRIMDVNLSHGSHYINTNNYPDFENNIQEAIVKVMTEYNIHKDDVVLYGASKGGTGALYHSMLGDYKSISIDPIISLKQYNDEMNDAHYLKGLRKESLLDDLLKLGRADFEYDKIVIGCPMVPFNYNLFIQVKNKNVVVHEILDREIKSHPDISPNCISEQVTFINNHFLNSNNYKKQMKKIKKNCEDIGNV